MLLEIATLGGVDPLGHTPGVAMDTALASPLICKKNRSAVHHRHDAFSAAFLLAAVSGIMLGGPSDFLFLF